VGTGERTLCDECGSVFSVDELESVVYYGGDPVYRPASICSACLERRNARQPRFPWLVGWFLQRWRARRVARHRGRSEAMVAVHGRRFRRRKREAKDVDDVEDVSRYR
jgi:hypothetical protein